MARARNIKPGFFQNDMLGELDPLARLFFIGLWTVADFRGCLEYRPNRLKVQLLPYDNCRIEELANNLERSGFILIYSVQGQKYIKVVNFDRHQNPHKNEREAGSDCPDFSEEFRIINELSQDGTARDKNGTAPADSLLLIPDSGSLFSDPLLPSDSQTSASLTVSGPEKPPARERRKSADEPGLQDVCRATWTAYASAYLNRYGTAPIRDAKVNSCIKAFVKRVPMESAPQIAAFFVGHNNGYYVSRCHDTAMLQRDAPKLHTEWITGQRVTQAKAREADRIQTEGDGWGALIAEARAKELESSNGN